MPQETAAADVVDQVSDALQNWSSSGVENIVDTLLHAALLLVVCLVVMKVLLRLLDRALARGRVERSLHTFIRATAKTALWFVTILLIAQYFNISATSLIAVFSVAGLALSLAIQGTLSNLAGGLMLLASKPFKVGDYIEAGGVSGTVADIGLVYTRMSTVDNKMIYVPNGEISGEKIVNYNAQEKRRVDLKFSASYDAPAQQVKSVIQQVIGSHPCALPTPEPFVRVNAYQDSCVDYVVRVWCASQDYWTLYHDLLEQVKAAFDEHQIEMTYPHVNVHMIK